MELIITAGLSYGAGGWNTQVLPWPLLACVHLGLWVCMMLLQLPCSESSVVLVHRWWVRLGRVQVHHSHWWWVGLGRWDDSKRQRYPHLRSDDHQNSQVSVEAPGLECLSVLHCQPSALGMEERCGDRSLLVKSLGLMVYSAVPEAPKAASELNPLLQCSVQLLQPGLLCFSCCLLHYLFNFDEVYFL